MDDRASPDEPLPTRTEAEGLTIGLPDDSTSIVTGRV